MENSKMGGNTKEKMAPAKPLSPIFSFQALQKTPYGDVAGTSSYPPQAPNESNKVEIPPTRNAFSGAAFVDSTSKLAEQFRGMNPNLERKILHPKKLRRNMSNRRSAKGSKFENITFLANLEFRVKTMEDRIVDLQLQQSSLEDQKRFLAMEQQTLEQEIEVLNKEALLRDAEIERGKAEVNRLRELKAMQREKLRARLRNRDIVLLEPGSNDPISNQGNGEETSYIPAESSQMQIPPVPNMHETNLTPPNCMGSISTNHISGNAPNPK